LLLSTSKEGFASLQWLHLNPKEVGDYLHTRKFFSVGVLELMDSGHQGFCGFLFLGSGFRIPGFTPLDFFGSLEWRNAIFLGRGGLVLDV
jgi:hypothetical protein